MHPVAQAELGQHMADVCLHRRLTSAIAVNMDPALLRRLFRHVRQVAVFRNGLGAGDDEQGAVIDEATGWRLPWRAAWPALRDFS